MSGKISMYRNIYYSLLIQACSVASRILAPKKKRFHIVVQLIYGCNISGSLTAYNFTTKKKTLTRYEIVIYLRRIKFIGKSNANF